MRSIAIVAAFCCGACTTRPTPTVTASEPARAQVGFEQNVGQFEPGVIARARLTSGTTVFAHARGLVMASTSRERTSALGLEFATNRAPRISLHGALGSVSHYLTGNDPARWHRDVRHFSSVRYHDLFDGIDLHLYSKRDAAEYDLIVEPHANPKSIAFAVRGGKAQLDAAGNLLAGDAFVHRKPVAYQMTRGGRIGVDVSYAPRENGLWGFSVGAYDAQLPLIIDPVVDASTYLGGNANDFALGVAADATGVYVAGYTVSTNFPVQSALDGTYGGAGPNGLGDAVVSKLSPDLSTLVFSTYIGGSGDDAFTRVRVDSAGRAHLVGLTNSTDYPTVAAIDTSLNGGPYDAVVTVVAANGGSLVASTYFGGANDDRAQNLVLDSSGNIHIAGWTTSSNLPVQAAVQATRRGGQEGFVLQLAPLAASVTSSTYLGGSGNDRLFGIDLVGTTLVVSGDTSSTDLSTTNAVQTSFGGGPKDAFFASYAGGFLTALSYLGGLGDDGAVALAAGASNISILGTTTSANFPVVGAFQTTNGGGRDAFVTTIAVPTSSIVRSTYFGGTANDFAGDVISRNGTLYFAGETASASGFPIRAAPFATFRGGDTDGYVVALRDNTLEFSTYIGGSGQDNVSALAITATGRIITAGWTNSSNLAASGVQQTVGGQFDGFVVALVEAGGATLASNQTSYMSGDPVQISWSGFPTNAGDWISVAFAGSPSSSYERFIFTGGASSGTTTFTGLAAGTYEARGYFDWPQGGYTIQRVSPVFTIAGSFPATVTTTAAQYAPGQSIEVTFSGMSGSATDWIALAVEGSAPSSYLTWQYTGGGTSGSLTFAGLQAGRYVARAYFNNGFELQGQSAPFQVANPSVTLSTNGANATAPATVTVTFANMPAGNTLDWIAIAEQGSPTSTFVAWSYTNGASNGSVQLTVPNPGNYVARAYANWVQSNYQYLTAAESTPFTIRGPNMLSLTADQTTYTAPATVVVTYNGFPGNLYDWVSLATEGSPSDSPEGFVKWGYTFGNVSGTLTFTGVPAGTYRIRGFFNWPQGAFNVEGQSATTFVVQ